MHEKSDAYDNDKCTWNTVGFNFLLCHLCPEAAMIPKSSKLWFRVHIASVWQLTWSQTYLWGDGIVITYTHPQMFSMLIFIAMDDFEYSSKSFKMLALIYGPVGRAYLYYLFNLVDESSQLHYWEWLLSCEPWRLLVVSCLCCTMPNLVLSLTQCI